MAIHSAANGHRREMQFASVMAARGIPLERPDRRFNFKRCSYLPDFWSPSEDVYYEVIGSRQRWEQIYPKLELMDIFYPDVTLRVVQPNGDPVPTIRRGRRSARWTVPFATRLQGVLDDCGWGLKRLGEEIEVGLTDLSTALCATRPRRIGEQRRDEIRKRVQLWLEKAGDKP